MSDEKREFQRLHLTRPIDGWFGDFPVRLVDVSAKGGAIEHDDEIPAGSRALLRFYWRGDEIEITAEIVHNDTHRSGLRFIDTSQELRRHLAASTMEILRAQEANALGDRERNIVGDETLTAVSTGTAMGGYITCTLTAEGWRRRHSLLPDQPPDGFTVAAREPADEVDLLCRTYESGDAEARRLTRLMAELSVASQRGADRRTP